MKACFQLFWAQKRFFFFLSKQTSTQSWHVLCSCRLLPPGSKTQGPYWYRMKSLKILVRMKAEGTFSAVNEMETSPAPVNISTVRKPIVYLLSIPWHLSMYPQESKPTRHRDLGYGQCIVPVTTAKLQNQPGCPTEGVDQENMAYTCNGSSHCKEWNHIMVAFTHNGSSHRKERGHSICRETHLGSS